MGDPNPTDSSELERSTSRRASTIPPHVPADDNDVSNDYDDDYDLQAAAVSDGFRPMNVAHFQNVSHVTRPSVSSLEPPVPRATTPRPSSVSKAHPAHESYSHGFNAPERAAARSSIMSTDFPIMAAETPYEGPSGPSHPYQMYSQDVRLARTASLATTSTAHVSERPYNGPSRPTHPYGIYSQNVGASDDTPSARSSRQEASGGFPVSNGDYQRRIGPDGEEAADMIGPDGHTEQLPPYSRYPVEGYVPKTSGIHAPQSTLAAASSTTPPTSPTTQQTLDIPGAGGIGLATRNPEFASTEDLSQLPSPESRQSVRSFTSEASHHSINTAALGVTNEKATRNWKTVATRKVWGAVPCWAVGLGVVVLVFIGVVGGTVLGTLVGSHFNKDEDPDDHDDKPPYSVSKPAPGFIPLPTVPPGLPPLVEGEWSLPLFSPLQSHTCFDDQTQRLSWNCDAITAELTMKILRRQGASDLTAYALDLYYNISYTRETFVYMYGVQPPLLVDQQLQIVNDTFERERGAAWAFALPYNKTIILPEHYLSSNGNTTSLPARSMRRGSDFKRKEVAQNGEKPWICTWPGTLLEVFIYAGQNSSFEYPIPSTSTTTSSSSITTGSSTGVQSTNQQRRRWDPGYNGHHRDESWPPHTPPFVTPIPTSSSVVSSTSSKTSEPAPEETDNYFNHPVIPLPLPPYPRVVKVEERRNSELESPAPLCSQVEIVGKGMEARPVLDDKGVPIQIRIAESMPVDSESQIYLRKRKPSDSDDTEPDNGDDELSDCGCIWWVE